MPPLNYNLAAVRHPNVGAGSADGHTSGGGPQCGSQMSGGGIKISSCITRWDDLQIN